MVRELESFHPFQGRPSFGRRDFRVRVLSACESFHPFQGRPSFGPGTQKETQQRSRQQVSIPFREDLHSDAADGSKLRPIYVRRFPSLSGKTFIRTIKQLPYRFILARVFPSLSGKTSIRTKVEQGALMEVPVWFPSLSGKTSIRTPRRVFCRPRLYKGVSIPFREDLHSDKSRL